MGDVEPRTPVLEESLLGYHPLHARDLTLGLTKPGTVPGGQFDWGGSFRAGRNLPDKEFRYLRTVIVTAAVYWGFNSELRPKSNPSS